MSKEKIVVANKAEAWQKVRTMCPEYDNCYQRDVAASENAGYDVYRHKSIYLNYVCDLGDRLEINCQDNSTTNIWIINNSTNIFTTISLSKNEMVTLTYLISTFMSDNIYDEEQQEKINNCRSLLHKLCDDKNNFTI